MRGGCDCFWHWVKLLFVWLGSHEPVMGPLVSVSVENGSCGGVRKKKDI